MWLSRWPVVTIGRQFDFAQFLRLYQGMSMSTDDDRDHGFTSLDQAMPPKTTHPIALLLVSVLLTLAIGALLWETYFRAEPVNNRKHPRAATINKRLIAG